MGISWNPPSYSQTQKLPFIPLESEIDSLIAGVGTKASTLLQLLKETGMRIGETSGLRWVDIDEKRNTITINSPEKNSNSRAVKVTSNLISMIKSLPMRSERVFGLNTIRYIKRNFLHQTETTGFKASKPSPTQHQFPYTTPLEGNNGIQPNQRHSACKTVARSQEYQQHPNLHSAG